MYTIAYYTQKEFKSLYWNHTMMTTTAVATIITMCETQLHSSEDSGSSLLDCDTMVMW